MHAKVVVQVPSVDAVYRRSSGGCVHSLWNIEFLPNPAVPPNNRRSGKVRNRDKVHPKYWRRRYYLWSKFDYGIRTDPESWYEVTPENVAKYTAWRLSEKHIIYDACSGVGGNSIQFAIGGFEVYSIDVSSARMEMMRHNASIYGVEDRLHYIQSDISAYLDIVTPDRSGHSTLYISPPWGGVHCYNHKTIGIQDLPFDLEQVLKKAWMKFGSFVVYLPRHFEFQTLEPLLASIGVWYYEVESIVFSSPHPRVKAHILYVDQNILGGPSVFRVKRDRAWNRFSTFVPGSKCSNALFASYIKVNYLARYISAVLNRLPESLVRWGRLSSISLDDIAEAIGHAQCKSIEGHLLACECSYENERGV